MLLQWHIISTAEHPSNRYNRFGSQKLATVNMNAQSAEPLEASIVVTLYNKAPFIKQTLKSALLTRCARKEIVVVEDGSADGSDVIAAEMASRHREIRLLRNPGKGATSAMNFGIEQAKGNHIYVLDGDDLSVPWRVEICSAILNVFPQVQSIGARHVYASIASVQDVRHRCERILAECGGVTARRLTAGFFYRDNILSHSSAAFRKTAWRAIGGYRDSNMCYDLDYYIRMLSTGEHWMLNIPLGIVVDDRTSIFKSEKYEIYLKDFRACQQLAREAGQIGTMDYVWGTARYTKRKLFKHRGAR